MTRYTAFTMSVSLTFAVLWFSGVTVGRAEETQPSTGIAQDWTQSDHQTPFDASTQPFEFRSTNPSWPLVQSGDASQLSVKIRSLPQHADRDLTLVYELIRVVDGAVVGREQTDLRLDASGDSEAISIASSAPNQEGVYEIRCRLAEKADKIWSKFSRVSSDFASIKTPWLVYPNNSDTPTPEASLSDVSTSSTGSAKQWRWHPVGPVDRINPSDWQTPSWMPDRATRLVPNVKRVSESLAPWRNESESKTHRIKPGESFVGLLTELTKHRPYQLSVAMDATVSQTKPATARIDFATSPGFESVTRSVEWDVDRQKTSFSDGGSASAAVQELLHYAEAENEFIRITNESASGSIAIESVTLSEPLSDQSESRAPATSRTVTLDLHSVNWLSELSDDYSDLEARGGYSDSTATLFRIWKAASRLDQHAQWCGYREIAVPLYPGAATPPKQSSSDLEAIQTSPPNWTGVLFDVALARWLHSIDLPVIAHSPENVPPAGAAIVDFSDRDVAGKGVAESASSTSVQIVDSLLQKNSSRLVLRAAAFPMTVNRSCRELVAEFSLTPIDATSLHAEDDTASGYVQVFASKAKPNEIGLGVSTVPITVVNSAPWVSEVTIPFSSDPTVDYHIIRESTSRAALLPGNTPGACSLTVPPSSIVNLQFSAETGSVRLDAWQASMVGGARTMETLKEHVGEVVGKLGTLALPDDYEKLRNGGFEVAGQVGIVGWMHTQFPSSAVALDSVEAIEGSHSIRMTTDAKSADRTWLVSEPIPVPESGRLAVSLATRANAKSTEPTSNAATAPPTAVDAMKSSLTASTPKANSLSHPSSVPTHRVRVSLEGNRLGKPVRFASEFDVPCDGQWQLRRIVLETDQVGPSEIDSLRLTIDSLSPGKLWVDDIHLHDRFPTQIERTALQGKAFLAIQGLQHGNLQPAAQLLNNDWSKYLLAQSDRKRVTPVPAGSRNISTLADVESVTAAPGSPTSKPDLVKPPADGDQRESVADRFRDWLPRPIRF